MVGKCLFCFDDLAPGSEEHVFLSALGGRLTTRQATCSRCNNDFAKAEFGKIDDALADAFLLVRCALLIRSGRDQPPPTIVKAGRLQSGAEYDLAPGLVPITRRGLVPDFRTIQGNSVNLVARDFGDAKRMIEIAEKRGVSPHVRKVERVETKAPRTEIASNLDLTKMWRAVAKTALVGSCVLYGNETVHSFADSRLRQAVKTGKPEISEYAGCDYVNIWPSVLSAAAHRHTPSATRSSFDHSLLVADVGEDSVAYVELFGAFRFSLRLGRKTGLPAKGFALNPRARGRIELAISTPANYERRCQGSYPDEARRTRKGFEDSMAKVLSTWDREASQQHFENLAQELIQLVEQTGFDDDARRVAISEWTQRIAQLENGHAWRTELDMSLVDDDPDDET